MECFNSLKYLFLSSVLDFVTFGYIQPSQTRIRLIVPFAGFSWFCHAVMVVLIVWQTKCLDLMTLHVDSHVSVNLLFIFWLANQWLGL